MEKKLSSGTTYLMIGTALLYDLLQFCVGWIPFVGQILGWIVSFFAGLTFWLWFRIHDIPFNKKRTASLATGVVIEIIPLVNMLPAWTLAVVSMIATTKIKEVASKVGAGTSDTKESEQNRA